MDILAKALATVLVELLRYFQARTDIQDLVRKEIEAAGLKDANEALGWKAAAVGAPDGGVKLVVRGDSVQITLPGQSPDPPGGAGGNTVPPGVDGDPVPPAPGG